MAYFAHYLHPNRELSECKNTQDATIITEINLIPDGGRILLVEVVGSAEVANCHLGKGL